MLFSEFVSGFSVSHSKTRSLRTPLSKLSTCASSSNAGCGVACQNTHQYQVVVENFERKIYAVNRTPQRNTNPAVAPAIAPTRVELVSIMSTDEPLASILVGAIEITESFFSGVGVKDGEGVGSAGSGDVGVGSVVMDGVGADVGLGVGKLVGTLVGIGVGSAVRLPTKVAQMNGKVRVPG